MQPAPSPSSWSPLRGVITLAGLTALSTCAGLTHINVETGGKATVPAATLVDKLLGGLSFAGFDKVDFTAQFKNQGVTKDEVNSVKLKTMTLKIDAPSGGNFDFIQSVAFFAQADGLDKVQIASIDSIPKGKQELDLTVSTTAELKPYVVAPSMQLVSQVQGSKPDMETTVSADVVLDVDVHIPGCN